MNYYQESEEKGNELFTKWAEAVGCFQTMERQDLFSRVDWKCVGKKGTKINCELKVRSTLKYPDIFIEPSKYEYLMKQWEDNQELPWFINMCEDLVFVFDLRKCDVIDKGQVRIWSHPDQCYKMVHRYALSTKQAFKFKNGVQYK